MTEREKMDSENHADLSERLSLIEGMIGEGRRTTARWGWSFVLWGSAYMWATAWVGLGGATGAQWAWPVTMTVTAVVNGILGAKVRRRHGGVETTVGRAMRAIWTAMGMALFLFGLAGGVSGHGNMHMLFAGLETILGMAYVASAIVLRWKAQFVCGLFWWAMALVAMFGTVKQAGMGFMAGTIVCMMAFGAYMMLVEEQRTWVVRG